MLSIGDQLEVASTQVPHGKRLRLSIDGPCGGCEEHRALVTELDQREVEQLVESGQAFLDGGRV